jgi:ABC-type multidrug transport system fused ATPase/permease subunit
MKELQNLLWQFIKENKFLFYSSFIFMLIVPIRDIVLPLLYGTVVTAINNSLPLIIPLIIVTSVLVIIQILEFLSDWHDTKVIPKLQTFIRRKILLHILNKYEDSIEELELGELNTKLVKLPTVIASLLERIKNFLIPNILLHIIAICLFFYIDSHLGFIALITIIILYFIISKGPKKCNSITTKRDKAFNKLHEEIDDGLRNLYSIYGANRKGHEIKRLEKFSDIYNNLLKSTTLCSFSLRSLVSPVVLIFTILLMMRIQYLVSTKTVDLSVFVPVFFITLYLINSFMSLDDHLKHLIVEIGIIMSSIDVLKPIVKNNSANKNTNKNTNNNQHIKQDKGIGLSNVSFKFQNAKNKTLDNVNLHINHGEKVVILGDIGSGKSTILKVLLGYYKPTEGFAYYDDKQYNNLSLQEIRKKIGYVPQVPVLFNRSILENILYGNNNVSEKDVEKLLEELGVLKEFNKHSNGLNTKVGKNGSLLSGGQRQLVWCLRVLLSNPEVLILDEPTSSIDEKSKIILRNMLERFMKDKTVIMVTHDPAIMSFAKKIVIIKAGHIDSIKTVS